MPKQGTRTFPNLLRVFGIAGAEGRRLKFALGNDVSAIVNADSYDPHPTFMVQTDTIGPFGVLEFPLYVITAPPDAVLAIQAYQEDPLAGNFGFTIAENLPALTPGNTTVHVPVSGLGVASGASVFEASTLVDLMLTPPYVEPRNGPIWNVFAPEFYLSPRRSVIMSGTANGSFDSAGFLWREIAQPPPGA